MTNSVDSWKVSSAWRCPLERSFWLRRVLILSCMSLSRGQGGRVTVLHLFLFVLFYELEYMGGRCGGLFGLDLGQVVFESELGLRCEV